VRGAVALIALALAGCNAQPASTGGIVSTNPCADQLLLALAPPGRIAAISHYSQEEAATSIPLDVARRYRGTAGTAEEVIALKPDLVLASSFTPAATLRAYQRLGLKVLLLDSPTTIAASRDQIRTVAFALGAQVAGRRLIARVDAAVAAAVPNNTARPAAMLFISDNFANGGPTLLTEMLDRAGFGTDGTTTMSGDMPIERVMGDPPSVILEPDPDSRTATLRRRVLARAGLRVAKAQFPRNLVNCGGPTIIPAMQRLAAIRASIAR
jgi:iron complex transport system substrate-binding protein